MYQYIWDPETGGLLLTTEQSKFSKEPRPVYYRELDILGFDQYWDYPKDDSAPIMWAEANVYIYKGRAIAKTKGGSLYTKPEIVILEDLGKDENTLRLVDIDKMCEKNHDLMETLSQETIKHIYNVYRQYQDKIDIFYVAFSGGKDSVVALDLVQRALPHDSFKVLFGDTRMEFPDTYEIIEKTKEKCEKLGIEFYIARSRLTPQQTWKVFGPPATANRWCCSVHKTSPQINLLREITGKYDFTGMAFTGIRAEESATRGTYEAISEGKKHAGQYSFHGILDWGTAELFLYIFEQKLDLNKAYLRGNVRAGCLVCPNSSGKHDYIKRFCYPDKVDAYLDVIANTSVKTNYSKAEMQNFIDSGFWRTRRSGRSLNFGQDFFSADLKSNPPRFIVYRNEIQWKEWAKTIGDIAEVSENEYVILYQGKSYRVCIEKKSAQNIFSIFNCSNSKDDIKFLSLFRSVIIKSLYCIGCGVCEAECKNNCIDMKHGIKISDNCAHCYKCHEVHEHCLRYNSIRNRLSEESTMNKKLSGYGGHGPRAEWLEIFAKYSGGAEFWNTDGDGIVPNKKKEMFRDFLKDAGIVAYDKNADGDKFTKNVLTEFGNVIINLGAYSEAAWALILSNLVYTADYNWYVKSLNQGEEYTSDSIKLLLEDAMANDASGHGKSNMVEALKIAIAKTPLGTSGIFAYGDMTLKVNSAGKEQISLNSITRCEWSNPIPEVILYSLYKFAEACGDYYQFTLETLLDNSIEREGVSPSRIFGLDRETMVRILNGLSINYPEFISASFTLDLDNITLRDDKTSADVLKLF